MERQDHLDSRRDINGVGRALVSLRNTKQTNCKPLARSMGRPASVILWRFPSTASCQANMRAHATHTERGHLHRGAHAESLEAWNEAHAESLHGCNLWKDIQQVLLLDYSHRCQGPLSQILRELLEPNGCISPASMAMLKERLMQPCDKRLLEPRFSKQSCPVGVLRHSIRDYMCVARAQQFAKHSGQGLLVAVAADRCHF